ncbi:hypothetical protein DPMN_168829 [Dreissena polymorpha]|uniref:Uncharacterized protein n=1 Tax=Dreissena polymorpha TaxID=45954 RepID=A0A9D4IZQ5_DREPO|nr:hypothetical protein DPMN_168829 [Dreissena polymorpha]
MHTFCVLFVCLLVIWVSVDDCHGNKWSLDESDLVPFQDRDQDKNWIEDHVWVPIVSGLVLVGIIVLCCLCCCGCCACCRRDRTVVMQSAQSSVVIQSTNVMHAGYNQ